MKDYILLAIAIVAGIVAFIVAKVQIERQYEYMRNRYETVELIVFRDNMLKGDKITIKDLKTDDYFREDLSGRELLVDDVPQIESQKLSRDVPAGVPITWADIVEPPRRETGSPLARMVRQNERALSVPVDLTSSVTGMIQPNDHVDIIVTFRFPADQGDTRLDTVTLTLLQNVNVMATGQELPGAARQMQQDSRQRGRGYGNITLAVTPKEAELLVFAQQKGKLTFSLRNPDDVFNEKNIQDVNWIYLQDHLKEYNEERERRMRERLTPGMP